MYTFIKRQQDYFNKYAAASKVVVQEKNTPKVLSNPTVKPTPTTPAQQVNNTKTTTTPAATPAKTPSAMDVYNKGMVDNNYTGDKARNYFRNGNFDNMAYYQRWQQAKTNADKAKIQQEWTNAKNQSKADYINRLKSIDPKKLTFSFKGNQLKWQDDYGNAHFIDPEDAQAAGLNIQYAQQNDWNRGKDNYSKPGNQIGWHATTDGSAIGTVPMHEVRTINYGTDAMNKMWGWANPKTQSNTTASRTPVNGASTGTGNPSPANGDNKQPVNDPKQKQTTEAPETNTNPYGGLYELDEESTFKTLYGDQNSSATGTNNPQNTIGDKSQTQTAANPQNPVAIKSRSPEYFKNLTSELSKGDEASVKRLYDMKIQLHHNISLLNNAKQQLSTISDPKIRQQYSQYIDSQLEALKPYQDAVTQAEAKNMMYNYDNTQQKANWIYDTWGRDYAQDTEQDLLNNYRRQKFLGYPGKDKGRTQLIPGAGYSYDATSDIRGGADNIYKFLEHLQKFYNK